MLCSGAVWAQEVLRNVPDWETSIAGAYDRWPGLQGFDHFYGFIGGEANQWAPGLFRDNQRVEREIPKGQEGRYTLNDALADETIKFIFQEKSDLWERLSPFNEVEKIVTPTLIVGGEKDWNVPIVNSEQLFQALKRLGRTTELVVYPGEYHGIQAPSHRKDLYERYLAWYDKYVKGEAPTP